MKMGKLFSKKDIIILIIFSNFFVMAPAICAQNTAIPYCKASQLKIYEIADYFPGMMQSQALYGIINISGTKCKLHVGTPYIQMIAKKGHHIVVKDNTAPAVSNTNYLILEPLDQKGSIDGKKIVWFSIWGAAACEIASSRFDKIIVKLPGIRDKTFSVGYGGYSSYSTTGDCGPELMSGLQKSIYKWDVIKNDPCSCEYDRLPFAGFRRYDINHPPYSYCKKEGPARIYFKEIASCG